MKLWLDDLRDPRDHHASGWLWARTVGEAIQIVDAFDRSGLPWEALSLDHDLGNDEGGDAIKFVHWMIENDIWPEYKPAVHSANPVGRINMLALIDRYGPYDYLSRKVVRDDAD